MKHLTPQMIRTVKRLTLKGYGVEDISVRLGAAVSEFSARQVVKAMRDAGELHFMEFDPLTVKGQRHRVKVVSRLIT